MLPQEGSCCQLLWEEKWNLIGLGGNFGHGYQSKRGHWIFAPDLQHCSSAELLTWGQRKTSIQSGWSLLLRTSSACTSSLQLHGSIPRSCSVHASLEQRDFSPGLLLAHKQLKGCMLPKHRDHTHATGSSSSPREILPLITLSLKTKF